MSENVRTEIKNIKKLQAFAGRRSYRVDLKHTGTDWSSSSSTVLTGSDISGCSGPVTLSTNGADAVFVDSPEQYGSTFGPDWIRSFYAS